MKLNIQQSFGLWRSLLIYHGIPFRKRRLARFYRPFIRPGDLCFDIGAHVGNRLGTWTKLGAHVVALEPQPQLMRFLRYWYGHKRNIILLREAAGAVPGIATMYASSSHPTVTSLSLPWINQVAREDSFSGVKWDQQIEVKVTTLDQLIQEYGRPALCKIDVEGFELQTLQGLSYPIPILSFEYIPAAIAMAQNCISRLSEIGNYRYNWSIGENYQLNSSTWLKANEMLAVLSGDLQNGRSGDIYARHSSDH